VVELRAEEAARLEERELAHDWLEWRLQGGLIGHGVAPLDVVVRKIEQIQNAAIRVYEMLAGLSLRRYGPPPAAVRANLQMTIAQPSAGSFRFRTQFSAPLDQPTLFDDGDVKRVDPNAVANGLYAVLGAVATGDPDELVRTSAADGAYRQALLQLVKVLLPDGRTVRTIEVVKGEFQQATDTTVLSPQVRQPLELVLRSLRPRRPIESDRVEIVDTLRGIHLNDGWIVLGRGEEERKVHVGSQIVLEDVIKGLVDETVKVIGHLDPRPRSKDRIVIDEIAEAPGEPHRFRIISALETRQMVGEDRAHFGLLDDESNPRQLSSGLESDHGSDDL
jgi:hypothetical protein